MRHRHFHTTRSSLALLALLWLLTAGAVWAQEEEMEVPLLDHAVQEGDTLLAIAIAYNTSVAQLKAVNNLENDDDVIYTGQIVKVPVEEQPTLDCAEEHVVQLGESLWGIAVDYGRTTEGLAEINRIDNQRLIATGQVLCIALRDGPAEAVAANTDGTVFPWGSRPVAGFWYTVNQGDTLAFIGSRYDISAEELRTANALAEATDVEPNQLLWIPGMDAAAESLDSQPWVAQYHDGIELAGPPVLERREREISHFWRESSPHVSVPVDSFSVVWTGEFRFDSDVYRFIGVADHGIRIYIDDDLVLDNWQPQPQSALYADVRMTAGSYAVRVEYREVTGNALVFVAWHVVPAAAVE